MSKVENDPALISYCGLYCAACGKYKKNKCPGCAKNEKAPWCKVRTCCIEHNYKSCADCSDFDNIMECKLYNNFFAKIMGLIFRSDRAADIKMIKDKGYEEFAKYMAENELQAIKK